MTEQVTEIDPITSHWLTLPYEKSGLVLFRYRLKGGFNLVERLVRPDWKGGDFLEGRIDTDVMLDWQDDIDVRKKCALKNCENKDHK